MIGRAFNWELISIVLNLVGALTWTFFSPEQARLLKSRALFLDAKQAVKAENYILARHVFRFVSNELPDCPESEEATYRSASIALRSIGDFKGARSSFQAYLTRYPNGRYHDDAEQGLAFIESIPPGHEPLAQLLLAVEQLEEEGRFDEALALISRLMQNGQVTTLTLKALEVQKRITGQARTGHSYITAGRELTDL